MSTIHKAETYILQHPREQFFYRILGVIMTFTCVGNQQWWGLKPPNIAFRGNRLLVVLLAPILFLSQVCYLIANYKDLAFDTLGIMFSIMPVTVLVNVIIRSAKRESYKKIMGDFMDKIHLYNYKDESQFARKICFNAERYTRWTSYFLFVFLMLDFVAWICITGYNNLNNKEAIRNKTMRLQTVLYIMMPFDYEYNFRNWIITHSFNAYFVWSGCIIIIIYNSINYAFTFHLIGHIHILKYKIETAFIGYYKEEDQRKKLVDIIQYHSFVTKIFKQMISAFDINVTANYAYNLFSDSLSLYQIMFGNKGDLMTYGLMIVVYMGGLILMSFVLEEIRRQSDGLSDLVYNMPWEKMSVPNQKILIMILARMQPPMVFEAAGGLKAGVQPMVSIIKSIFSYYVMLKSSM